MAFYPSLLFTQDFMATGIGIHQPTNRKATREMRKYTKCPLCQRKWDKPTRNKGMCPCIIQYFKEDDGIIRIPRGHSEHHLRELFQVKLKRHASETEKYLDS